MKNKISPLLWIVPLFVFWYLFHLLTLNPNYLYLLSPMEELYRGAFAKDLIEGLQMPILHYRPDTYNGGFFIIGFLIAFYFKFLGFSFFVLKLAPLTFALLGLLFWYLALNKSLGQKTAICFALLYIFAPPTFIRHLLWAMGNHPQTLAFSGLALWAYFSLVCEKKWNQKKILGLGLILGFGLWFSYTVGLLLLALLIHLWFIHRKNFTTNLLPLVTSFLVGFSPWLFINFITGFSGFRIQEDSVLSLFWHPMLIENLTMPSRFIGKQWFSLFLPLMENPAFWRTIGFCYIFFIILPFFFLSWKLPKNRSGKIQLPDGITFLFIYGLVSLFLLQLWPVHAIRLCIPAVPILFALIAYVISQGKIFESGLRCIIVLIFLGILSQFLISDFGSLGAAFHRKGYSYLGIGTAEKTESYMKNLDQAKSRLKTEDFVDLVNSLEEAIYERNNPEDL